MLLCHALGALELNMADVIVELIQTQERQQVKKDKGPE